MFLDEYYLDDTLFCTKCLFILFCSFLGLPLSAFYLYFFIKSSSK